MVRSKPLTVAMSVIAAVGFSLTTARAQPTLNCDFDANGTCDVRDLDALLEEGPVGPGVPVTLGVNEQFDLSGDGFIDNVDVDIWLADAATVAGFGSPYLRADGNLDGVVDVRDFNIWNAHKFVFTLLWSEGNFNGDPATDVADPGWWNSNKFLASDGVATAVPEPVSSAMILIGLLGLLCLRK